MTAAGTLRCRAKRRANMMDVIIKETGELKELWVTGPNGTDDTDDFVGNSGGFTNRDFVYDEEREVYVCSQDAYDWWEKVISDNERLKERIRELKERYGNDAVEDVVYGPGTQVDLEDYAAAVNGLLDEVFGKD